MAEHRGGGLALGGGASRYEVDGGALPGMWKEWHASVDGTFERFMARGEFRSIDLPLYDYQTYYGQIAVYPTPKLGLHGILDYSKLDGTQEGLWEIDFNNDHAFGASYSVRRDLVLKSEVHFTKGYQTEGDTAPVLFADPAASGKHLIFSVSSSF
jgi:hypothetical protein